MEVRRLLVVDGNPGVTEDLKERLTRWGYDVVATATSGREAIALAAQLESHLVLMDLALPGDTSGIAASGAIQQRRATPVTPSRRCSHPPT